MAFLKRPHQWLSLLDRYDVGYSAAPNFAYELCVRRVTDAQLAGLDLSRWTFAANGSEPIRASTLRDFAERFAPAGFRAEALAPCYGMAEATVFVSGLAGRPPRVEPVDSDALEKHVLQPPLPEGPVRELVGCGNVPDFDGRIVDPADGTVLPDGTTGEDLAARPQRGRRLLGPPGRHRGDLRRAHRRRRRTVPAHRRPGRAGGRRDLCDRPQQGPADRARPQPLPPGHRARAAPPPPPSWPRSPARRSPCPCRRRRSSSCTRSAAGSPTSSTRSCPGPCAPPSTRSSGCARPAWCCCAPDPSARPPAARCSAPEMRRLFLDGALTPLHAHLEPAVRELVGEVPA